MRSESKLEEISKTLKFISAPSPISAKKGWALNTDWIYWRPVELVYKVLAKLPKADLWKALLITGK